jgi:hypothetical protein
VGADDLMRSTEAGAQQGPVIALPPPIVNTLVFASRSDGLSSHETGSNGRVSGGLLQEDSHNTQSKNDIEMQIDTSMIRDPRYLDGEPIS